jgi:hypothetical protein
VVVTDEPRAIRDILAECLRRERLGLIRPLWADWSRVDDASCEQVRLRADHLIRLLADLGVELVQTGEPKAVERPDSAIVMRCPLAGNAATERMIRCASDRWEIATITAGVETVEQSFTLTEAMLNAGLVLSDDPEARTIPALGRRLAAVTEIYRLNAATMPETGE